MSSRSDQILRRVWAERLERYPSSGLTIIGFCKREGISTASFYQWRKRLKATEADVNGEQPGFVPVRVNDHSGAVMIRLPGGTTVELPAGTSSERVQEILTACVEVTSAIEATEPVR